MEAHHAGKALSNKYGPDRPLFPPARAMGEMKQQGGMSGRQCCFRRSQDSKREHPGDAPEPDLLCFVPKTW